jgi:O-methyltransferase
MTEDIRATIKSELMAGSLRDYVAASARPPHPYLDTIRQDCLTHKWNFMLTTPDQAAFLFMHARLTQAKHILELGTYFGHSTLALAAALPTDGQLISIEHNPKFAARASVHMQRAGLSKNVDIRVGEALAMLPLIEEQRGSDSFDLIFIDADKRNTPVYWEASLRLTRPGGLIILDNVLARGQILDQSEDTPDYVPTLRAFNEAARSDQRVFSYIASLADGLLVALKL